MSYEEKGIWVFIVVTVTTYTGYVVIILNRAASQPVAEMPYVKTLLWSLGISIASSIAGRILVEILKPSDSYQSDVRDKDINRHGDYISGGVMSIGMLLPFILAMLESPYFWISNAIYLVFVVSTLTGAVAKLTGYRRGL
jgi:hypothetical protein